MNQSVITKATCGFIMLFLWIVTPIYAQKTDNMTPSQLTDLGNAYYAGKNGKKKDFAKAVAYYRKAAEKGYARGQRNLGFMYENGEGVAKNYAEAVKWYRKAAEQGLAMAQYDLGRMYDSGKGVKKDTTLANVWYLEAANQGYEKAKKKLEERHIVAIAPNYNKPIDVVRGAYTTTTQGNLSTSTNGGLISRVTTSTGSTTTQGNLNTTTNGLISRVTTSTGSGSSSSTGTSQSSSMTAEQMYQLGRDYDKGTNGKKQDFAEALKWYRKAADKKYAPANTLLGVCTLMEMGWQRITPKQ